MGLPMFKVVFLPQLEYYSLSITEDPGFVLHGDSEAHQIDNQDELSVFPWIILPGVPYYWSLLPRHSLIPC